MNPTLKLLVATHCLHIKFKPGLFNITDVRLNTFLILSRFRKILSYRLFDSKTAAIISHNQPMLPTSDRKMAPDFVF